MDEILIGAVEVRGHDAIVEILAPLTPPLLDQLGRDAGSGADQSDLPAVDGQRPTLLLVFLLL